MRILALETTSAHASLALLEDDVCLEEVPVDSRQCSRELLPALTRLLAGHSMRVEDIGLLAVASGPGSFTGARIGLTVAKGLMEVKGIPAVSVSTLQAVAAAAEREGVVAALDASRGEVYFGWYPHGAAAYPLPGDGTEMGDQTAAESQEGLEPLVEFLSRIGRQPGVVVSTPHPALAAACSQRAEVVTVSPVLAAWVGRVGRRRFLAGQRSDPLRLDAHYIRRSDAELYARPSL